MKKFVIGLWLSAESVYNLSHEVRTMERINNEWKIVQASVFWNYNPVTAQHSE
jgi:hypothetical protein